MTEACFNGQNNTDNPSLHLSSYDMCPILEYLHRKGQNAGHNDLVFSELHKGGIGPLMLDADSVNVKLAVIWVHGHGPQFVWSAIKLISKGQLSLKVTCWPLAHSSVSVSPPPSHCPSLSTILLRRNYYSY